MCRLLRRLGALCLLASLGKTCFGQVSQSQSDLVAINDHSFIDLLTEHNCAPAALKPHQLYLLVRLGAAYESITACADPRQDAKALAKSLVAAIGALSGVYSQEDGFAAARVNESFPTLFSKGNEWHIDLAAIKNSLVKDGWEVFGGVKVASDVSSPIPASSIAQIGTNTTYPLDPLLKQPLKLGAHLGAATIVLAILVGFGPMTALVLGFAGALIIAKQKRIPLETRRHYFKILMRYPVFGTIGVCLPISFIAFRGGYLMAIADLWFGTYSMATAFMPFLIMSMPVPFLFLIPMSRVETRLFSPGADKAKFEPAKVVSLTNTSKKPFNVALFCFMGAGLVIAMSSFAVNRKTALRPLLTMLGYGLIIGGPPLAGLIASKRNFPQLLEKNDDPLVKQALDLAVAAKCSLSTVDVIEPRDQVQTVSISLNNSRLMITRKAISDLSEPVLNFGMAFALTAKPGRLMGRLIPFILVLATVQTFLMFGLRKQLPPELQSYCLFGGMVLMIAVMLPFMNWLNKSELRRQVRESLTLVPDRSAAKEWIEKSLDSAGIISSPKRTQKFQTSKLKCIDEVSSEMGLA